MESFNHTDREKAGVIYGLFDPRKEADGLFYIGLSTAQKKCRRLSEHIYDAKNHRSKNSHKERLIRKLLSLGIRPEFRILEEVFGSIDTLKEREKFWIANLRPITNKTSGGDWNPMWSDQREAIICKIRDTLRRRREDLAQKLGLSVEELQNQRIKKWRDGSLRWRKQHPEKSCEYTRTYRVRSKNNMGVLEFKKKVANSRRNWYASLSPEQKEIQREKDRIYRKARRQKLKGL